MSKCQKIKGNYKFLTKIVFNSYDIESSKDSTPFYISDKLTKYTEAHLISGHELVPIIYENLYINKENDRDILINAKKHNYEKVFDCKLCATGNVDEALKISTTVFNPINYYTKIELSECFDDELIVLHTQEINRFYGLQLITTKTHYNQEAIFYNSKILNKMINITKDNPKIAFIHTGLNGSVPTHFHVHATIYRYNISRDLPSISEMEELIKNTIYYKVMVKGAQTYLLIKCNTSDKGKQNLYKFLNSLYATYIEHKQNVEDLKTREYFFIDKDNYFSMIVVFDMKGTMGPVFKRTPTEFWYDPVVMAFTVSNLTDIEDFEEFDKTILVPAVAKRVYIGIYEDMDIIVENFHNFKEYTVSDKIISKDFIEYSNITKLFKTVSESKGYVMSDEYKKSIASLLYFKNIDWIRKNMDYILVLDLLYKHFSESLGYVSGVPASYGKLTEFTDSFGDNINYLCNVDKSNRIVIKNKNIQGFKIFLKSYQNKDKQEAFKEFKISEKINILRKYIPHFQYTHLVFNNDKKYYTIVENISKNDTVSLVDVIKEKMTYLEMLTIFVQILMSVYFAQKELNFCHGNLTIENITLIKLDPSIDSWLYELENKKYNIKLYEYYIYITDFKKATFDGSKNQKDISDFLVSLISVYPVSYDLNKLLEYWMRRREDSNGILLMIDYVMESMGDIKRSTYTWGSEAGFKLKSKNVLMENKRKLQTQIKDIS